MLAHRLAAAPRSLAGWSVASRLTDLIAVAAGIGVWVTSSVIPYVFDQLAMSRVPRATYALFVSLPPATSSRHE